MSKVWTDSELLTHVESAVENIKTFLQGLLSSATEKSKKRASLIGYWINDYVNYQNGQDTFSPTSLPRYERGDIIEIHFGYRVGSELGGRHFGVVIDNKNFWSSPIVTVIPLTSLKTNYKESRFTLLLKKGLYELVKEKAGAQIKIAENELVRLTKNQQEAEATFNSSEKKENDISQWSQALSDIEKSVNVNRERISMLVKTIDALKKMKKGSILEVGQITTISKQRISNPKMKSDSLFGISLSKEDIQNLNAKIKELYVSNSSGT